MNRLLLFLVGLTIAVPWTELSARDREVNLIAGTLVQCTLDEPNLSSRTAAEGEPLVCYARPLDVFGCPAFTRGAEFAGHVTSFKEPGRLIGKGWIALEFDRLVRSDGEAQIGAKVISVKGFKVDSQGRILGKGHPKRDAAGWAIPVLWPIKLVTLPQRGPRPTLKGERVLTLRLMRDVQLPCGASGFDEPDSGWHYFGQSGRNSFSTSQQR